MTQLAGKGENILEIILKQFASTQPHNLHPLGMCINEKTNESFVACLILLTLQ